MSPRLHSLADLANLFGPDASAPVIKNGASAEAARREVYAMETIQLSRGNSNAAIAREGGELNPLQLIRDGVVILSAVQAGVILRRCRYARQTRDLTPAGKVHVSVLSDIMRRKQWRERDQLDFALLFGNFILINGHHRLTAQEKSDQDITWTVAVHPCASPEDVERLYYTFDTNLRGRSNETILSAMDAAHRFGITKTTVEGLYRAAPLLSVNFDFSHSGRDPISSRVIDRRMEMMRTYAREAQLWEAATKKAPSKVRQRLLNQGAFAVALTAFRHRPYEADQFYRGLAENDGLAKGDPRNTYLTALLTATGAGSGTNSHTARQAAVAWNAWVRGKSLTIIKIIESNSIVIAGTPVGR